MGLNQDTTRVELVRKLLDMEKKELLVLYSKLEEDRVFALFKKELVDECEGYFDYPITRIKKEELQEMYLQEDYNYKLDYSEEELIEEILKYGFDKIMEVE